MTEAVNRLQCVPSNAEFFDRVTGEATLMKAEGKEVGEVLIVTKEVDEDGNVNVALIFPTECGPCKLENGPNADTDGPRACQPTGIVFTLNAFLNTARMLAIQHKAVIGRADAQRMPEAFTSDDVLPSILAVPRKN